MRFYIPSLFLSLSLSLSLSLDGDERYLFVRRQPAPRGVKIHVHRVGLGELVDAAGLDAGPE